MEPRREVLLIALALSSATGRGFDWRGFGGRRQPPGLDALEIECVRAFADLTGGETRGLESESTGFGFSPGALREGAGQVELQGEQPMLSLLRALAVPLLARGEAYDLRLTGSTHALGGDTYEPTRETWRHFLAQMGTEVELTLERAGFAPRGGGEIALRVPGGSAMRTLQAVERDALVAIRILSGGAGVPAHVQQRQAARARSAVHVSGIEPSVQLVKVPSKSKGTVVAMTGFFGAAPITFAAVGGRGISAEAVGERAASELRHYARRGAVVPRPFVESMVVLAALASGQSRFSASLVDDDTESVAKLVKAFTGASVAIDGKLGGPAVITVSSEGLQS